MKILDPGHHYVMDLIDQHGTAMPHGPRSYIQFNKSQRIHENGRHGVTCQEVLRVLIDRVKYLQEQLPCEENKYIIANLRSAIYYFELRADRRKQQKVNRTTKEHESYSWGGGKERRYFDIENIELAPVGEDGHLL